VGQTAPSDLRRSDDDIDPLGVCIHCPGALQQTLTFGVTTEVQEVTEACPFGTVERAMFWLLFAAFVT
jgi:hypothetical protein